MGGPVVKRFLLATILLSGVASTASADDLDVKKTVAKVKACAQEETFAKLGDVTKAETIGKRPATKLVHLIGKKARGYVIFTDDSCDLIPVVGKPAAATKGNFGADATVAYALQGCGDPSTCNEVVSIKTKDDKLVDLLVLPEVCEATTMTKRAVFTGRDSLEVNCFVSGGADQGRHDYLLDAGTGALTEMLSVDAGIGWVQIADDGNNKCRLKIPGGFKVATTGDKPELDVTTVSTPEEAEAAKVAYESGGCDITLATRRFALAGAKFTAKPGKPKVMIKKKNCECSK